MTIDFAPSPPENHGFRRNSLRWFLRFYQRLRPEVVPELRSRVLPSHLVIRGAGQGATQEQREAFRGALESWIHEFGLPHSADMIEEATLTLLTLPIQAQHGRQVFGWDVYRGFVKGMKQEGSHRWICSHPLTFQHSGWTPANESLEEAEHRLKGDLDRTLSEHMKAWREIDKDSTDLRAFLKRNKDHVRNIIWLASKQACPDLSLREFAERLGLTECTVRRRIHKAADCLFLPRKCIRHAPPGRKPGPRSL